MYMLLIVCLYMYCRWRSSNQEGRVVIPLSGLTLPFFVPVPSQDLDFQRHMSLLFVFSEVN